MRHLTKLYIILLNSILIALYILTAGCGTDTPRNTPTIAVSQQAEKSAQTRNQKQPEYVEITSFSFSNSITENTTAPEHSRQVAAAAMHTSNIAFGLRYGTWQPLGSFKNRLRTSTVTGGFISFDKLVWQMHPEFVFNYIRSQGKETDTELRVMQFLFGARFGFDMFNNLSAGLGVRAGLSNLAIIKQESADTRTGIYYTYGINCGLRYSFMSLLSIGIEYSMTAIKANGDDILSNGVAVSGQLRL